MLCASCGTAGGDDIKLKKCTACHLVRYCSVKCQKDHRPQHKKACKKRAAELRDEILFKQPESSCFGDCPICYLPLPIDQIKCFMTPCCSKSVCIGCDFVDMKLVRERNLLQKCPFCREILPSTEEESNKLLMKRIEANDPYALRELGTTKYYEEDCKSAFDYWSKAADLGDAVAHFQLSVLYRLGEVVEIDAKKELHHLEEAAIGGHPNARHNLGTRSYLNGRVDRAVKHLIIAAKLGYDKSMENVKDLHKAGHVSKEDFAAALRGHKAAIDATKSLQREQAAEFNLAEHKRGAF